MIILYQIILFSFRYFSIDFISITHLHLFYRPDIDLTLIITEPKYMEDEVFSEYFKKGDRKKIYQNKKFKFTKIQINNINKFLKKYNINTSANTLIKFIKENNIRCLNYIYKLINFIRSSKSTV